jgi:hypothetical protein
MALDSDSVPDVDATAGMPDAPAVETEAPTTEEMQAMMEAPEGSVEVAAPAVPAPAAEAPPAEPGEPGELPPPPAAADGSADAVKLRKGWASLAKDKEALVAKTAEANAAIERAKAYEQQARDLAALPDQFAADPLEALFRVTGKKTIEEREALLNTILDKVVEQEKSPVEKEILRLRQEIAAKESKAAKDQAEREQNAEAAKNQQILAQWQQNNVNFASSTPENIAKYDMIVALKMGEAVHQTCLAYHALHNVILDPAVAADNVEKNLRAGVAKSKYVQDQIAASRAAAAPAPKAPVAPPKAAQPSNGTTAPKKLGTSTLSGVASGDAAPAAEVLPESSDDRLDAVLRDMQRAGELPDEWRVSGPSRAAQ